MQGNINVPDQAKSSVPFFRVWCLVELQAARVSNKPIIMQGGTRDVTSAYPNIQFKSSYNMLSKMNQAETYKSKAFKKFIQNFYLTNLPKNLPKIISKTEKKGFIKKQE